MECTFCEDKILDIAFAKSINFLAIYNLAPIFPGHTLIIPVNHIESVLELQSEELNEMIMFTRSVTTILLRTFKAEAFNWSVQDKEAAGQTIAHLHMHIVLRFKDDLPDPGDWYPKIQNNHSEILDSASRQRHTPDEMHQIVDLLRKESKMRGFWI
jgi:bis(5'-adenosyl)-triphosphatase